MNDPIEEKLNAMKPAELSPALMARLTAARSQVAPAKPTVGEEREQRRSWWHWLVPVSAVAAGAVVALSWLKSNEPVRSSKPSVTLANTMPVQMEDRLLSTRELGTIIGPNQRPYAIMEVEWLESDTVKEPGSDTAIRVDTTRREVIPVAMEIF